MDIFSEIVLLFAAGARWAGAILKRLKLWNLVKK
jgi:hypothetical protein